MSRAAIRYAKAVINFAKEKNAADAVYNDMIRISSTIADSKELKDMLADPIVKTSLKLASLKELFAGSTEITTGLLNLLAENKRIELLADVAGKYIMMLDELNGKQTAVVTTAVPLSDALKALVLAKVKELTGNEASIENKIDESIIGGFILRVGDIQYNASIASKLSNLRREFINN